MDRVMEIAAAEGAIDAHMFTPDGADKALPPVVMFTDIGGLRPSYYEKAQKVAEGGYAVLLPNIYYRDVTGQAVPDSRSYRERAMLSTLRSYGRRLTPDALAGDFEALLRCIDAEPEFADGGIGVVGYCMTGGFALRMAANHSRRVVAAAGFHSARLAVEDDPASPLHVVDSIEAQVYLGHADRDELMPPDQIARLDGALAEAGVHFTTELYRGAGHGYSTSDAPAHDEVAEARHYKRLFTLLKETID
ncbi:MAG: dienelactone hydrolase family protein [Gammaproteobacteria bacterium]|nr:dienelactone hydrolase family protein [Gammaproteobacteria bacterium]